MGNSTTQTRFKVRIGIYAFAPGIVPTIVTILTLSLLVNLGFWQLRRAHAKEFLLQRLEQRSQLEPIGLDQLLSYGEDLSDYPLHLEGRYLADKTLLLDNRTHNGIAGYDVLTAFVTHDQIVLVNRGWIARGPSRDIFPQLPEPVAAIDSSGLQSITGISHQPNPNYFVLKEDDYQQVSWPYLIQKIDLEKSAQLFDYPVLPFVLRLQPDQSSGFVREWQNNIMGPEKHYGYALQWFSLAFALVVIYLVVNTSKIIKTQ